MLGRMMSLAIFLALAPSSAEAQEVAYACGADADAVFGVTREAAEAMPDWRSLRVVDRDRTVRAVVRGRRNIAVPVWLQVRESEARSELHVMWEQSMEPLNYPDLIPFLDVFDERQEARGLACVPIGTDIGP